MLTAFYGCIILCHCWISSLCNFIRLVLCQFYNVSSYFTLSTLMYFLFRTSLCFFFSKKTASAYDFVMKQNYTALSGYG